MHDDTFSISPKVIKTDAHSTGGYDIDLYMPFVSGLLTQLLIVLVGILPL